MVFFLHVSLKHYPFLFHPIHATFSTHILLLDFVTRTIFREKHKAHVFSLGNSPQLPAAPSPTKKAQTVSTYFLPVT